MEMLHISDLVELIVTKIPLATYVSVVLNQCEHCRTETAQAAAPKWSESQFKTLK